MVSSTNVLNLFKFFANAFTLQFHGQHLHYSRLGQANLLAIGHSKSFQTISRSDLHSCLYLRDTSFSKGRKVTETSLQKSCPGALYLTNTKAIQTKVQGSWGQGDKFWIGRKCLGHMLDGDNWHIWSMSDLEHDQTTPAQVQWHSLNQPRMLYLDPGSCDLGRQIRDG